MGRATSFIVYIVTFSILVDSQYSESSSLYKQAIIKGGSILDETIEKSTGIYVPPSPSTSYLYYDPLPDFSHISLAIDPCRGLPHNCCMNVFGTPEYPALISKNLEPERVVQYNVLGSDVEVQVNYQSVYEDGTVIDAGAIRAADDDAVIDLDCRGRKVPYSYCMGENYAYRRSPKRPPCSDNNVTLDAAAGCTDPLSEAIGTYCMQIGFSHNAFIAQCKDMDIDCGTFLEVHMVDGSPYQNETIVIAETRLTQLNVSGMYTTTIPTTWYGNSSMLLCNYTETFLRVGSTVYITSDAPVCCCPPLYSADTRLGSFFCPLGPTGKGPFARNVHTLTERLLIDTENKQYPFCHDGLEAADSLLCSVHDTLNQQSYTRNCSDTSVVFARQKLSFWGSPDLVGAEYVGACPYFSSCAVPSGGVCHAEDDMFTFVGRVGKVTALDNVPDVPLVWVTFNDGRTNYVFEQRHVRLEYRKKSMYELWWVLRAPSQRIVMKRKGFNVTSPGCTFDLTNNRYFPFAVLDSSGNPMDSGYVAGTTPS